MLGLRLCICNSTIEVVSAFNSVILKPKLCVLLTENCIVKSLLENKNNDGKRVILMLSTIAHKISGTNSSFRAEWRTAGKVSSSIFRKFSSSINKAFILAGRLGAGLSFYGP